MTTKDGFKMLVYVVKAWRLIQADKPIPAELMNKAAEIMSRNGIEANPLNFSAELGNALRALTPAWDSKPLGNPKDGAYLFILYAPNLSLIIADDPSNFGKFIFGILKYSGKVDNEKQKWLQLVFQELIWQVNEHRATVEERAKEFTSLVEANLDPWEEFGLTFPDSEQAILAN